MKKARVLIIDKDVLARQAVGRVLQTDGNYDICIKDGFTDLEKAVRTIGPDILLLDIEQLAEQTLGSFSGIKESFPNLPIVVLSSRTEKGAELALYALRNGAVDFITKPENRNGLLFANRHLKKRILPALDLSLKMNNRQEVNDALIECLSSLKKLNKLQSLSFRNNSIKDSIQIITIGSSTGGPSALIQLLPKLPENPIVPIVIVQHSPKHYIRQLASYLDKVSKVNVREAYNETELLPGTVWLIPGGYHAEFNRVGAKKILKLHRGPREKGNRPSIDVLFRSASNVFAEGVLGIILSGCCVDGIEGTRAVHKKGGTIWVQDPRTTLSYSLPLSVLEQSHIDRIYSLEEMGQQLTALTERKISSVRSRRDSHTYKNIFNLHHFSTKPS